MFYLICDRGRTQHLRLPKPIKINRKILFAVGGLLIVFLFGWPGFEEVSQSGQAAETQSAQKTGTQLAALTATWENIALPIQSKTGILKDSSFLWGVKNQVKISVVPFVRLPDSILQTSHPQKIDFSIKSDQDREPLVEFSLEENGITYEWNIETLRKYADTDSRPKLNRIFLSKLRIEIPGCEPKEIALWTPVVYRLSVFQSTFKAVNGRNRFTLWTQDGNAKEIELNLAEGDELMLLDFDELSHDETVHDIRTKTFERIAPSSAYAPKIPPVVGVEGHCGLTPVSNGPFMYIDFFPEEKMIAPLTSRQKELTAMIAELAEPIAELEAEMRTRERRVKGLQQNNKGTRLRINAAKKGPKPDRSWINRQENVIQENNRGIDQLNAQIRTFDARQTPLKNQKSKLDGEIRAIQVQIANEKKKWQAVRPDSFAIDLLKPGTSESDVEQPENRLPLFRVVSDPK